MTVYFGLSLPLDARSSPIECKIDWRFKKHLEDELWFWKHLLQVGIYT
jgi:hypothetical protein